MIGGGEGSRTPVQKHCYMLFSERSLRFDFRALVAHRRAINALSR